MITAIAPAMMTAYIPMETEGKGDGDCHDVCRVLHGSARPLAVSYLFLSWTGFSSCNVPVGDFAVALGAKAIPVNHRVNKTSLPNCVCGLSGLPRSSSW